MTAIHHIRHRAFTLIELLVVIGIIVILIGILLPTIAHVRRAARGAATTAQLAAIGNAIQQYYGDFHAYPGPLPNNLLGQTAGGISPTAAPTIAGFPLANVTPNTEVTGSENLVLGLLGGLQVTVDSTGVVTGFNYVATDLFTLNASSVPTGTDAKGALSLNPNRPKRYQSYLQVGAGDISEPNPGLNSGHFVNSRGQIASDTNIPEFLDKYQEPMPILYMRANPGGTAVASKGGKDDSGNVINAQWDIDQILGYTDANPSGGLRGLGTGGDGTSAMTDTISHPATSGMNALAYLKDPTANSSTATNIGGSARQKDGYILISAGPDRIYGTADDVIFPGSLSQ